MICVSLTPTLALALSHAQNKIMVYHMAHGIADKPHPQEQYFQESPFLIGQGIPGKTGPQERGDKSLIWSIIFMTQTAMDPFFTCSTAAVDFT